MRPADRAWVLIAAWVVVYDILLAPDGETLSEGADRWLASKPWITRLAIFAVAKHLCNELNPDPLHYAFHGLRRLKRRRDPVVVTVEIGGECR